MKKVFPMFLAAALGLSLLGGCSSNIILNIIMTPILGALGAAIATAICYYVTWIFRYIHARKIIKLKIKLGRDITTYVLLVLQSILLLALKESMELYATEIVLFIIIVLLYSKDISKGIKKVFNSVKGKKSENHTLY